MLLKINKDNFRKRNDDNRQGGDNYWRPESGKTKVRFIPGWLGDTFEGVPFVPIWQHYLGGDVKRMVTCPSTPGIVDADGNPRDCPVCKLSRDLRRRGSEIEAELGNSLKAREKKMWTVVVRGKESEGPKIWTTPKAIHDQLSNWIESNEEELADAIDLVDGFDMIVSKDGTGLGTTYSLMLLPGRKPISQDEAEIESLVKRSPDLTKQLNAPTDAQLGRYLSILDGGPEPEPAPAPAATAPSPAAPVAPPASVAAPVATPPKTDAMAALRAKLAAKKG